MKKNKNKKGFTLPELIAVLVILVVIALIAINTIKGVLNKANETIDKDKEKQILNAAEKWAIENSDKFDDTEASSLRIGLDVVFVVDVSGSMAFELEGSVNRADGSVNAINEALTVLNTENDLNRVGFVFYSGLNSRGENVAGDASGIRSIINFLDLTPIKNISGLELTNSAKQINLITTNSGTREVPVNGGTYTSIGVRKAFSILQEQGQSGRIPVIILLTDGSATYGTDVSDNLKDLPMSIHGDGSEVELKVNKFKEEINEEGHTIVTFDQSKFEYWTKDNCTHTILTTTTWPRKTEYDSCKTNSYSYNRVTYYDINDYINAVLYSGGANNTNINIMWDLTRTSYLVKQKLAEHYNATSYFYTIGLGVTAPHGRFMLDPSEENLTNLEPYDDVYNFFKNKKEYQYPTAAFTGKMSAEELKSKFKEIASEVVEATKITQMCVTTEQLYNEGYLSNKDAKLSDGTKIDEYVLINMNEATNQFVYTIAQTDEQKKQCESLLKK